MSWITFASTAVESYGNALLQYDDGSTGSTRSCRLQFVLNAGSSIYVYFDNVAVDGSVVVSRTLVSGTTTIWSGSLNAGYKNFSFSCPWGSGTKTYSGGGTLPSGTTPPTGLAVSNVSVGADWVIGTASVSSWGAGSGPNSLALILSKSADPRYYTKYNIGYPSGSATSLEITIDNTTSLGSPQPAVVQSNFTYYLYVQANNGSDSADSEMLVTITTLPAAATISLTGIAATSVTAAWSTDADGGVYNKTLQYSINNGTTWTTFATVTGGAADSGTFTISGLTEGTTYTLMTRATTTAGTTVGSAVTFRAVNKCKFYGTVSGGYTKPRRRRIALFYGSNNGSAVVIKKLYGSRNGVAKRIF